MTKTRAWLFVAGVLVVVVAFSGCATFDDSYCSGGRALRVENGVASCFGYGALPFGNGPVRASPIKQPWWLATST